MEGIKKYTNLNEIPKVKYEGYIWLSDQEKPEVIRNTTFDFNTISTNPFIIEGLLFDEINHKSIHITHDGTYSIVEYDLSVLKSNLVEQVKKEYLPHRLDGVDKVHFVQVWTEINDPLCNDLPVLTLQATVFCGFKKLAL